MDNVKQKDYAVQKKFGDTKYLHSKKILSELYDTATYEQRRINLSNKPTSYNLLKIDDWSKTTPKELKQHINNGNIANRINGYGTGPSPLIQALQQGASRKIIKVLIAGGDDVNITTPLPSGANITPLEIIRLQPATHDNLQKELMLLRSGAKDDAIAFLKKHKTDPAIEWMFKRRKPLQKQLQYMGIHKGEKIFKCDNSYTYIKEVAGQMWIEDDLELYDKVGNFRPYDEHIPDWLTNELGIKLAKKFFLECEEISANEAMHKYYMYLAHVYKKDKIRYIRICNAAEDFRKSHLNKHII